MLRARRPASEVPAHLGGVAGAGTGTGGVMLKAHPRPLNGSRVGPRASLPGTLALTLRVHSMIVRADRAGARRNAGTGRGVSAWRGRHY